MGFSQIKNEKLFNVKQMTSPGNKAVLGRAEG